MFVQVKKWKKNIESNKYPRMYIEQKETKWKYK